MEQLKWPFSIEFYEKVTSTNDIAKEKAGKGAAEGTVIVAKEQTAGRGRNGRTFYSPKESGLYMSLILRPSSNILPAWLTTAAAVAVAETIEEISGQRTDIKWVNDIYRNEQKICGILTEGSIQTKTGGLAYAIVGIGINIQLPKEGFPEELKTIATSIFEKKEINERIKSSLITKILEKFWEYYQNLPELTFFENYQKRMFLIGKQVEVIRSNQSELATVLGLDRDFGLCVQMEDGKTCVLYSGEVRIKPIRG